MKIKKRARARARVSFFIIAALSLAACTPFFCGCGAQKNYNCRYALNLSLNGNALEGVLDYSEGTGARVRGDGLLCFCLQPNYLFECERLKNSEQVSAENYAENYAEQPLEIVGASAEYEILQNGAYMAIKPVTLGGERGVKINFSVKIPEGSGRLALTEDGVNLACFYPYRCAYSEKSGEYFMPPPACEGDPFFGDFADYDVTLSLSSAFVVAGVTPRFFNMEEEVAEYRYSLKNRRTVAFCLSKNFNVISKKSGNRSINCYFVNDAADKNSKKEFAFSKNFEGDGEYYRDYEYYEKLTALAADCLNYFNELFGDYKYNEYAIAFTPFDCGGMEYSSLSVINKNQSVQSTVKAIVHETAHQWLPLLVSNNEYEEAYFDEGFAEFAAFKYFSAKNSDLADDMLSVARKTVAAYTQNVSDKMKMNRALNEFKSEYDYYACVYARGLLAFCEAEKIAGERRFLSSLKKFAAQNSFKRAGASDFLNVLSHRATEKAFLSIVEGEALLCLPK